MAGKISLLVGFGAGYVLGARSGRERYEQIASKAQEIWRDPRVQEKAGQAQQLVKDKSGEAVSVVAEKAGEAGSKVGTRLSEKVSEKTGSGSSDSASTSGANGANGATSVATGTPSASTGGTSS